MMLIGFASKDGAIAAPVQVEQQGLVRQSLSAMWMANSSHIHHGHQTDPWTLESSRGFFYRHPPFLSDRSPFLQDPFPTSLVADRPDKLRLQHINIRDSHVPKILRTSRGEKQ